MSDRLSGTVELSQYCILTTFKYQDPEFYARLFDESEEGPYGVPPGHTNVGVI